MQSAGSGPPPALTTTSSLCRRHRRRSPPRCRRAAARRARSTAWITGASASSCAAAASDTSPAGDDKAAEANGRGRCSIAKSTVQRERESESKSQRTDKEQDGTQTVGSCWFGDSRVRRTADRRWEASAGDGRSLPTRRTRCSRDEWRRLFQAEARLRSSPFLSCYKRIISFPRAMRRKQAAWVSGAAVTQGSYAEPWRISPEQAAANLRSLRGIEPQKLFRKECTMR